MQTQMSSVGVGTRTAVGTANRKDRAIVMLINSPVYFLDWAIIVFDEDSYRLLVSHKGRVSTDQRYDTMKGAKIAFIKSYRYLAFTKECKPQWSHPYVPYTSWLRKKIESSTNKYN